MDQPLMLQIMQLSTRITRELDSLNAQGCEENLSSANVRILKYLSENDARNVFQRDLEEALAIRRSTVSKIVQLMERKGLLRRESVDGDARLKRLLLTEKARQLKTDAVKTVAEFERRLTAGLSERELELLKAALQRIGKNLENIQEDHL